MRWIVIACILLLQVYTVDAQTVKAQVLDAETKQPIPFATVLSGEHDGVVTNEEGWFSLKLVDSLPVRLKISSMGYEARELQKDSITDAQIFLKPATIELKEVFLSDKFLTPEQIMEKVKEAVPHNYGFDLSQKKIFLRESNTTHIRKFEMKVEESTIPGIDQKLIDKIVSQMPKNGASYAEVLAELSGNYDLHKLQVLKAANLHDPQSTRSFDQLTEHLELLFKRNLKSNSFLKIKSGWFGVKVDAEELEGDTKEEESEQKTKTPEELAKQEQDFRLDLQKQANSKITSLFQTMFWKEDITFDLFEKTRKYTFDLEGYMTLGPSSVYVIHFKPKRRADFKGTLYVDVLDYGVHRIDFENTKPLSKFRLLGISTMDNVYKGKMIFVKNPEGKYLPNYLEREEGSLIGIDRPLTIIEKNRHVPGRNKQNELDLEMDVQFGETEKLQLVVYDQEPLTQHVYDRISPENGSFEYRKFRKYNPDFWKGYHIIEPNTAIKQFTTLEAE